MVRGSTWLSARRRTRDEYRRRQLDCGGADRNEFAASIVVGTRFVAVGSGGGIFTSGDGLTWTPSVSGTTNDLTSVTFSTGIAASLLDVGYIAVARRVRI
jgi:hypothetical protein